MIPYTKYPTKPTADEEGFALVATLMILVLLTIIGLFGINTTSFELKIAGNERQANQRFYTSDSGWKQGGPYLNAEATPPDFINTTLRAGDANPIWTNEYYQIVRNFGNGGDEELNTNFPGGTQDGFLANVPYWYRVRYQNDFQALQFGENYRDFEYEIISNASGDAEVKTIVRKVYRVGY